MADPASGRCWLFYYPSLTSLLVLLRPVGKPNFNILDPQGPVPRKSTLASCKTLARKKDAPRSFCALPGGILVVEYASPVFTRDGALGV